MEEEITEERFIEKFEEGSFCNEELLDILYGLDTVKPVYENHLGNNRFSNSIISVVQAGDRFFRIEWEEGNGEETRDFVDMDSLVEVFQKTKTITKTYYEEVA